MITTIIFDFDGTIADTLTIGNNILRDLSTKYGYKRLSEKESEAMRDYTVQEVFKKLHVPLYKLPLIVHDVKKELNQHIADLGVIEGIDTVLHQLKRNGYQLAIITSNNKENVKIFLKNNDLENCFDFIYTGTTIFGKARVIQNLLNKYLLEKDSVVYIGDEIRDIEATRKVGISIIAGSWGLNSRKGLERYSPDYIVDSPHEIMNTLKKLA